MDKIKKRIIRNSKINIEKRKTKRIKQYGYEHEIQTETIKNSINILIKITKTPYYLKCTPYKNQKWKIKIINEKNEEKEISKSISSDGLMKIYLKMVENTISGKEYEEIVTNLKDIAKKNK